MRIVIANVHVPFIWGGAEILAESLSRAFINTGHKAEVARIPFNDYPQLMSEQLLAFRKLDLRGSVGMPIDLLVCMKFPTYLIPHPNKVLWIPHQYRQAYDLWNHPLGGLHFFPNGENIRQTIIDTDKEFMPQAREIFTISKNCTNRLKKYCGIDAHTLYHPPRNAEKFYCEEEPQNYFFVPSRITPLKRQELIIRAASLARNDVRLRFAGAADSLECENNFNKLIQDLKLNNRIEWLGFISEEQKFKEYAHSLSVIFVPYDEDYGYVTLEAMLSSKAVITCSDSGGTLEFVDDEVTGLIAQPTAESLAAKMDELWENRQKAKLFGEQGKAKYLSSGISWENVVSRILESSKVSA